MQWIVGLVEICANNGMVRLVQGGAKNAPQGRARIAQRFIAGIERSPPLLLLAGEAREQEKGGANPSGPPLKRRAILARPSGTKGLLIRDRIGPLERANGRD